MRKIRFPRIAFCVLCLLLPSALYAQTGNQGDPGPIRSSPAYAEILLRKTEIQADLEALLADYTEANPKIIDLRFELGSLDKALERVFSVRPSETSKLTLALGKMIVRKAELETDLNRLLRTYNKDHQEVKRMQRRVDIYDTAIKEILK
jgi:uncharacterized protein involved in exopolysaccharide biosynthesis